MGRESGLASPNELSMALDYAEATLGQRCRQTLDRLVLSSAGSPGYQNIKKEKACSW